VCLSLSAEQADEGGDHKRTAHGARRTGCSCSYRWSYCILGHWHNSIERNRLGNIAGPWREYEVRTRAHMPVASGEWRRRVRSDQTNPLWTKITPGIAGLAAGSHERRPALNEIREFRKTMPRPRRGSELDCGGPRAAKSSCSCPPPHWTSREPVFAAGEGDMLAHPLNKGLMAQAYL
jgi:hypothetical protein